MSSSEKIMNDYRAMWDELFKQMFWETYSIYGFKEEELTNV